MPDRDELVRRALRDAAAPRPLAPETRDRLAALVHDDADARVAGLLREAATPRTLRGATQAALRGRLSTGVPARRPVAGVSRRATLALVSAAAAVLVVVATAVVPRPADEPGPAARPAPTGQPTAPPSRSGRPGPVAPPPVGNVAPHVGEVPRAATPSASSSRTGTSPPATPRPGDGPAGAPGAPNEAPGGPAAPPPQRSVSEVEPDSGPLAGGTVITVRGTGLGSAVRVEVGGRRARSLQVKSDSELTAETPAGARAGRVPVVVVMADGARYGLSPGFTYVAAPVLTSVSPDRGPASGGSVVVLSGNHFRADAVVRFGDARAEVRQVSSTSMEVVTPGHLVGPVDVTVTTPGGTSAGRRYTYLPA